MGCIESKPSSPVQLSATIHDHDENNRESVWNTYFDELDEDEMNRNSLIVEDRYHDDVNNGYSGNDRNMINKSFVREQISLPPSERSTFATIDENSLLMIRSVQYLSEIDKDGLLDDESLKEIFRQLEELNKDTHTVAINCILKSMNSQKTVIVDDPFSDQLTDITIDINQEDHHNNNQPNLTDNKAIATSLEESAKTDNSTSVFALSPRNSFVESPPTALTSAMIAENSKKKLISSTDFDIRPSILMAAAMSASTLGTTLHKSPRGITTRDTVSRDTLSGAGEKAAASVDINDTSKSSKSMLNQKVIN